MKPTSSQMRFLCFGVGAIGTYIGGSLALSGQSVVFLERPEVAPRLRAAGLTIDRGAGAETVKNPLVVSSMDEALTTGPFDAAILAVKSFDTPGLIETLRPYAVALPPIVCVQNGVENEPLLRDLVGEDRVIPGTVTTAIGRGSAGQISVDKLRGVGISSDHMLSPALLAALNCAGLRAQGFENAAAMKWSKMFTNLIANASSAILDMSPGEIFSDPRLFAIEIQMLREALAVMRGLSIPVVDLPGTPVRALAAAVNYLPLFISRPLLTKAVAGGRGKKMPSFHIDLMSGRGQSEVDYLNGAVVRGGKKVGAPTPVNAFLTQTLLGLTRGEIPLSRFQHNPEAFIKALQ